MIRFLLLLLLSFFFTENFAQNNIKKAKALRIYETIRIDGYLSENAWERAEIISGFRQYDPFFDMPPSQETEVRILYDDDAIYIGAIMYDSSPDSILKQLGNRNDALNADAFGFKIDTYDNQSDAYIFEVSASGVQKDERARDRHFNAVWASAVRIFEEGWTAEIRIPYAAIRFPNKEEQLWRVQFYRNLRRTREWTQWALEDRADENKMTYWGELHGIKNINPPLRLSFTPYLTAHGEHYPYNIENRSNYGSSFSGGIDLKWGIDESFTLDMTLLPDFSQVQSDNQIKNLTAFETKYDENRPFFQESVDLFNRDGLFYSRRIGRLPLHYYNVDKKIDSNEYIISNPYQAKLLNATKLSGRHKNGLAVGFFNAVTDNTYATIGDSVNGERKLLTDPMTNYNILVLDKAFHNNNNIYLVNTNVYRKGDTYQNANVTAGGLRLFSKSNHYRVNLTGAHSMLHHPDDNTRVRGHKYYFFAGKVRGNFLFNFWRQLTDNNYDSNDMGLMHRNNQVDNALNINYNIHEPFARFLNIRSGLSFRNDYHYTTKKITNRRLTLTYSTTLDNYLSLWGNFYSDIGKRYDYYEPRAHNRHFLRPLSRGGFFAFSSDYRKVLALDGRIELVARPETEGFYQAYRLTPIVRASDRFSFNYSLFMSHDKNDLGYAGQDENSVFFGNRDLQTVENTFSGLYVIKNDLSFNLRVRHYRVTGQYDSYYLLQDNGKVSPTDLYEEDKNFNFNSFNIDLVFNWQFAPGSYLSIIWKNALLEEDQRIAYNYFKNMSHLLNYPQLNTLTLKLIYYFDYQSIKRS